MEAQSKILLEICVDSVESALAAFKGGADRLELCSALSEGGLTPSLGLFTAVKSLVPLPIYVMIRPRGGDFLYTEEEISIMAWDIGSLKAAGADGFVFGLLTRDGLISASACRTLITCAAPIPCTFHRAFDMAKDPVNALEDLIKLGFARLLTSGQQRDALQGLSLIKQLEIQAGGNIAIMAGAGISEYNVKDIVAESGVREVHASASTLYPSKMEYRNPHCYMGTATDEFSRKMTSEENVRRLMDALKTSSKH